jgi:hypothetical protein
MILQLKRRNLMWVLSPHVSTAKKEKNPTCVLTPNASITIEEE